MDSIKNITHQTSRRPLRGTGTNKSVWGSLKIEFPPFGWKVSFLISCCSFNRWENGRVIKSRHRVVGNEQLNAFQGLDTLRNQLETALHYTKTGI
ncbi:hypothetical protein CDAR_611631 [Caerostris darwini]|uniref:Uncharacterized protein n=1 Tax=Caerostris darwini TaxID=1538125 RepID=A0AAV4U2Q8_9ARAC|nr:hypothetical protein CDAR_611631 [Caerostris darwini]